MLRNIGRSIDRLAKTDRHRKAWPSRLERNSIISRQVHRHDWNTTLFGHHHCSGPLEGKRAATAVHQPADLQQALTCAFRVRSEDKREKQGQKQLEADKCPDLLPQRTPRFKLQVKTTAAHDERYTAAKGWRQRTVNQHYVEAAVMAADGKDDRSTNPDKIALTRYV